MPSACSSSAPGAAVESVRAGGETARATLYVHPACSKSRDAADPLRSRGIGFELRDYVAQPLDASALHALIDALDVPAHELLRADDARRMRLAPSAEPTAAEVAQLLQAHPVLMQRPVLQIGARALIARPPERVLELL